MTDKELKKLSRLELLELLLIETNENQRLKNKLEQIERENAVAASVDQLNETSNQLQDALQQALSISDALDKSLVLMNEKENRAASDENAIPMAFFEPEGGDNVIYKSIISFFLRTPDATFIFPDYLRKILNNRLREIREKQNSLRQEQN